MIVIIIIIKEPWLHNEGFHLPVTARASARNCGHGVTIESLKVERLLGSGIEDDFLPRCPARTPLTDQINNIQQKMACTWETEIHIDYYISRR